VGTATRVAILAPILLVLAISTGVAAFASAATATPATGGDRHLLLEGNGLGVVDFGASTAAVTRALSPVLGSATGRPLAGCAGAYSELAWDDLTVQFLHGRFHGYRYQVAGWVALSPSGPSVTADPRLATPQGISIGSTMGELRKAYTSLRQSGNDLWRSSDGIVFAFPPAGLPKPMNAPVLEIEDNTCSASA
jgi:hypothetical protein